MPMRSRAQRKWMHANKPEMAKEWEAETSAQESARMPERVGRSRKSQRGESRLNRSSSLRR